MNPPDADAIFSQELELFSPGPGAHNSLCSVEVHTAASGVWPRSTVKR